jgi:hypothetical protein
MYVCVCEYIFLAHKIFFFFIQGPVRKHVIIRLLCMML